MHACDLELNYNILTSLSCPACKEYLTKPVRLCSLGHSVCGTCRRKLVRCPICARKLLDGIHTRNWAVENIIDLLLFPCPNDEFGCTNSCKFDDLKWHTETCPFRVYICHVTDGTKCSWYGRSYQLHDHICKDHSDEAWMINGYPKIWVQDTYGCNVESQILFKNDYQFWVHRKQHDGLLCWAVQYIGPQEECVNFTFTLTVTNNEPISENTKSSQMLPISSAPRKISLQAGVQPDALSPDELFRYPFRYACLSVRVFKMYQDSNDNITYTINIDEEKDKEGQIPEESDIKNEEQIEDDEEVEDDEENEM